MAPELARRQLAGAGNLSLTARAGQRLRVGVLVPGTGAMLVRVLVAALAAGYLLLAMDVLYQRAVQQVDITGHPFFLSDLFPRWYGARALLEGINPYGTQFTADLHQQYYGAPMPSAVEMGLLGTTLEFFYPPYVVVPLLPLLWFPFEVVRWQAVGLLGAAVVASAWLWADGLGVAQTRAGRGAVALFALTFYPTLDVLWLQQLTGLLLLYLVSAYVTAARQRYGWAGILLALAMIKPQAAAVPAAGLLFWSVWRRERWGLPAGFILTMTAQLGFSEYLLPGWMAQFQQAAARYREFNSMGFWLPGLLLRSDVAGAILVAGPLLALLAWVWWRARAAAAGSPAVLRAAALGFGVGVVVMPDIVFYNKTLLLVPLLTLFAAGWGHGALRRATACFAALAVAAPVVVMGVIEWMRWLALGLGWTPALFDVSQSLYKGLPLFVLPAMVTVCIERATSSCSAHPLE